MGSVERTPMLSPEGSREVEEEMARPPADTPERRATFARAREMAEILKRNAPPEAPVREQGIEPDVPRTGSSQQAA